MAIAIGMVPRGFVADDQGNSVVVPLPPQNGGAVGWGTVYLSVGVDFADVVLRVAVYNGPARGWRITEQLKVAALGDRVMIPVQDGDQKVSIGRVKAGSGDAGTAPVGWLLETTLKA